jgi:hypothetical protein
MRKVVSEIFEIELSSKGLTDTEDNNWFTDDMRLQFTFPFEVTIDDDLDTRLGMITVPNTTVNTVYPVTYTHWNILAQGELEILEITDRKASMQLVTGVEKLPSWDKKLSELPLANFNLPVGVNIYDHAQTIIAQTWPNVYYNFAQVHTNHKERDQEDMQYYLGRINNRNATTGNFEINNVDIVEGISYNRNIMQPLPYWLYLLQKGAEADGLTLAGDILDDNIIKRSLVYADVKYYDKTEEPPIVIDIVNDTSTVIDWSRQNISTYNVPAGVYRLSANVFVSAPSIRSFGLTIWLNNVIIYNTGVMYGNISINIERVLNAGLPINSIKIQMNWNNNPGTTPLIGLIETISLYDNGSAIPSVQNKPIINLKRAVPDVTFGDFLKITKNWFNYDWDVVDNQLVMNKIQTKLNEQTYFDISPFQTKIIPRKYNQGYSFVLSFGDVDTYQKIYHSRTLVATDNYKTNEKTTEIQIDGLPLPNAFKNGVFTADAFESNESKVYAVLYNGLTNGNNYTQNHIELLLPNIHELYWRDWFNFRINAQTYTLVFRAFYEQIKDLKPKLKCWAYNKYFVPRKIERKEIKPDLFEINIEMDSIEVP